MKHLREDSEKPHITQSNYTVFGHRFCPFTDRVLLTLGYHNICYDLILIDLNSKPKWLTDFTPYGKVPVLLREKERLMESDFIMRFIDELHGYEASMMSVCGETEFKEALELALLVLKSMYTILYCPSFTPEDVNQFELSCKKVQSIIKGKYLSGNKVSLADLALFPMLDRFEVVLARKNGSPEEDVKEVDQLTFNATGFPELAEYLFNMRQLPFVSSIRVPARLQAIFASTKRAGCADPDII